MKLHQGVRGSGNARPFRQDELPKSDPMTRLGKRVEIQGDCWILDGVADKYHRVIAYRSEVLAHRFVYEQVHDVHLSRDDVIHHRCERKGCINPEHLMATTHRDHRRIHAIGAGYEDSAQMTEWLEVQLLDT